MQVSPKYTIDSNRCIRSIQKLCKSIHCYRNFVPCCNVVVHEVGYDHGSYRDDKPSICHYVDFHEFVYICFGVVFSCWCRRLTSSGGRTRHFRRGDTVPVPAGGTVFVTHPPAPRRRAADSRIASYGLLASDRSGDRDPPAPGEHVGQEEGDQNGACDEVG